MDLLEITAVRAEPEALQAVFDGEPPALVLLRPDGYVGHIRAMALDPLAISWRRRLNFAILLNRADRRSLHLW